MAYRYVLSFAATMTLAACGSLFKERRPPSSYDSSEDAGQSGDAAASESENDGIPRSLVLMQGSEEGARAFLQRFVDPNADVGQLTGSLRPMTSDYEAIFDPQTAGRVEAGLAKDWNTGKLIIKPAKGQTEIKLWSATGTELAQGTGSAKEFPPEYRQIGQHLAPDRLFFRFKFVEPGKDTSVAYDALTFVQDHWVLVPKPWRALEERAPGPKPKGKGKGKKK